MPKKTRKMKQRAALRRSTLPAPQSVATEEAEAPAAAEPTVRIRPTFVSPRPSALQDYDYTHIYKDLKRIALFAGFFFAVLIALSFVIK